MERYRNFCIIIIIIITRKGVKHENVRIKRIVLDLHGVHGSE